VLPRDGHRPSPRVTRRIARIHPISVLPDPEGLAAPDSRGACGHAQPLV